MVCAKFQDHGTSGSVEDFLKVEAIYGHGSHLGYVIKTIFINLCPHSFSRRCQKFDIDWSEKIVGKNGHIHVYMVPGQGQTAPWGQIPPPPTQTHRRPH